MSSDSNDLAPPFGYPVRRNGTCYDTENDCGSTWGPYRECCPKGATCAPGNCCHSAAACGNILKLDPHCGNTSAILYYENDYFCCSRGTDAFARVSNGFVGCTDDVSTLGSEFSLLSPVSTTSSCELDFSGVSLRIETNRDYSFICYCVCYGDVTCCIYIDSR